MPIWFTAAVAILALTISIVTLWMTHLRGPKLKLFPADAMGLVRGLGGGLQAIHFRGALSNGGGATGVLLRLEAEIRDVKGTKYPFVWHLFYRYREGGVSFDKVSDPQPISVERGEAVPLFIQLRPADGKILFNWRHGEYRVSLSGWVNATDRVDQRRISAIFHVVVDSNTAEVLKLAGEPNLVLPVPVVEWRHPVEIREDPLVKVLS